MFKYTLFASVLFCASKLALAAPPPACVLACVNTQEDPSALKSICSTGSKEVQQCLLDTCPDFVAKEAPAYFKSVCNGAGHQIILVSPSPTSSAVSQPSSTADSEAEPSSTETEDDETKEESSSKSPVDSSNSTATAPDATNDDDDESGATALGSHTALVALVLGLTSFAAII